MADKSFRIGTTPGGSDNQILVKLDQNYDSLEILSLKIQQDKIYRTFTSDYGVLVGRVIANEGLGIPNAKVSVFIPLSAEDAADPVISQVYPYTQITDKTATGVRYNLLTPTPEVDAGTFPTKQQFLDDNTYLEVYEKYYKFTTVSNVSGDYMLFGVPVGQQLVHMDADLSDIGQFSSTADVMVANGIPKSLFIASGTSFNFKGGTNLEQLPQYNSQTLSANIIPLWGDPDDNTQLGITRLDFKINTQISPVAYLTFAIGTDTQHLADGIYDGSNSKLNGSGGNFPGFLGRLIPNNSITINAYKYDEQGNQFALDPTSYKVVSNTNEINSGVYMLILPCDNDKVVTDEYGSLVPSGNNNGIGTTGSWKVDIISNNGNLLNLTLQKTNANGVVPFKVKAGRIYSARMEFFQAYTLRDDGNRNIYSASVNAAEEEPMFNPGDWINGFLYFGYAQTNSANKNYATWVTNPDNKNFYNVNTAVIDVTDYIDILINGGTSYYNGYNNYSIKFFTDSQFPPNLVANLKVLNQTFGDSNSQYAPAPATSANPDGTIVPDHHTANAPTYVFFKGLNSGDCFNAIKKYIG